ncbi:hypothetical protein MATR_28560 [Marivirga tractuosa]|uniref:ABC transporter ATPase n=1 Tax=Marivirga tractuosa (strain ATCC 23168 / DSM 4126 / NBRC 15989 / NCIMB 1408 / VKM B-1430 / H-43) TaxID=643867 RepID=E4TL18_MARTH|nr:hypothetical protein [Marivirga tractuosa]ADR23295.1 hypothetical protein Ftrac_3321 [Marivirga tractuosa DSM 4126]BDD16031.1 hypothetical protein MATR_28560 [Marivirga tractuosa]
MYTNFNDLDKSSRLWVYQADRPFTEEEKQFVLQNGKVFVENWTAHNKALNSSIDVKYNQFIVLSVDETKAPATGCSIDKSVHFIKALENELKINLLDKSKIAFLKNGEVVLEKLSSIKSKVESGEISESLMTFNNMVTTKDEFDKNWLIPASESWMARFFKLEA